MSGDQDETDTFGEPEGPKFVAVATKCQLLSWRIAQKRLYYSESLRQMLRCKGFVTQSPADALWQNVRLFSWRRSKPVLHCQWQDLSLQRLVACPNREPRCSLRLSL